MASKSGYQGQLLYGTAGSTATNPVLNCTDLDDSTEPEKVETTVRGDSSSVPLVTEDVVALKKTVTWTMILKTSDSALAAFLVAAETGAAVALRTKSWASGTGTDADFTLSKKNGMPLKGQNTFEFTATPTDSAGRAPQYNV
jgi:hypothetical protein